MNDKDIGEILHRVQPGMAPLSVQLEHAIEIGDMEAARDLNALMLHREEQTAASAEATAAGEVSGFVYGDQAAGPHGESLAGTPISYESIENE